MEREPIECPKCRSPLVKALEYCMVSALKGIPYRSQNFGEIKFLYTLECSDCYHVFTDDDALHHTDDPYPNVDYHSVKMDQHDSPVGDIVWDNEGHIKFTDPDK